jgi:hypothetical protein
LIKPEDAKDWAAALLAVLKAAEAEEVAATQEPQTSDHNDQQPQISGTDQRNNGDSGHGDNNNDDKTPALRRDDSDDEGDLGDVVITNTEPAPLKPVKPPGQLSLFGAWGKTNVVRRKQKVGAEPEYVRDSGATRCAYTSIEASMYVCTPGCGNKFEAIQGLVGHRAFCKTFIKLLTFTRKTGTSASGTSKDTEASDTSSHKRCEGTQGDKLIKKKRKVRPAASTEDGTEDRRRGAEHWFSYSIYFKLEVIEYYECLKDAGTRAPAEKAAQAYGVSQSSVHALPLACTAHAYHACLHFSPWFFLLYKRDLF